MRLMTAVVVLALCVAGAAGAWAQSSGDGKREGDGAADVVKDSDNRTPPAIAAPKGGDARSPDSAYFTLEVCNRDRRKAFVVLSSRENPAAKEWYVAGWWGIQPGDCTTLGRYPKSMIYLHAEDVRGGQWRGRAVSLCVEKQRFKRVSYPGHKCDRTLLRGFYAKRIMADRYVWNLKP